MLAILLLLGASGYLTLRQMNKHRLPAAVWQCLRHPRRVTVYSLHPSPATMEALRQGRTPPSPSDPALFRGYRILGQTDLTAASDCARATAAVGSAATAVFALPSLCFDPRHGVRVSDGTATFDFVICYACGHLLCYEEEKTVAYTASGGSSRALDTLLLAAHVPAEKTPEEH